MQSGREKRLSNGWDHAASARKGGRGVIHKDQKVKKGGHERQAPMPSTGKRLFLETIGGDRRRRKAEKGKPTLG